MNKTLLVAVLIAGLCPRLLQAAPTSYTGTLTWTNDALNTPLSVNSVGADAGWFSSDTSVSWTVDNTTTPGLWHYEYTITVRDGGTLSTDIQCVILETSPTFFWDNLISTSTAPADWLASVDIGSFSRWDNQNLPSDSIYGVMFCTSTVDPTTLTISFDSDREPVWGDIYVRSFTDNGSYNTLSNRGGPDTDPDDAASSGSVKNHLLVPDTVGTVPAPGAVLLSTLGVSLTQWLRWRRRL